MMQHAINVWSVGTDEMSKSMGTSLDSSSITTELSSSKFVCIKLSKDSESHHQFTEICNYIKIFFKFNHIMLTWSFSCLIEPHSKYIKFDLTLGCITGVPFCFFYLMANTRFNYLF